MQFKWCGPVCELTLDKSEQNNKLNQSVSKTACLNDRQALKNKSAYSLTGTMDLVDVEYSNQFIKPVSVKLK